MHSNGSKPVRRTCIECRVRKVRCDGQRAGCSNCERLGFDCSFRDTNEQNESTILTRRPRRCRVRQACTACHELKIRCSGHMPTCHRCHEKDIQCVYPNSVSRRQLSSATNVDAGARQYPTPRTQAGERDPLRLPEDVGEQTLASPRPESRPTTGSRATVNPTEDNPLGNILTQERVNNALTSYFDHIYPLPSFSFLHRTSLLRWNQSGQADRCLLLSIIAIASRLPGCDPNEVDMGTRCAALAQDLILKDQGRPSIIKAQSLLLIIRYHTWSGTITEALVLMATLSRFAFILRLNYENPNICSLAQESRKRLMWAINILDTFLAGGLPEFTVCPPSVIHLSLPNSEESFELDTSYSNVPLHISDAPSATEDIGLLAYYIRVIYFRGRILRYTKAAVSSAQQANEVVPNIRDLEAQLDQFGANLPQVARFSEKNLQLRAFSKWLPRYIMVHFWFQQCYCDLYRCCFTNLRESFHPDTLSQLDPQFVLDCQTKCLYHARQIASICSAVQSLNAHKLVLDIETAECAYQAGRILIRGAQMGSEDLLSSGNHVVEMVNDCIRFVQQLALIHPAVSSIVDDLNTLLHHSRPSADSSDGEPQSPNARTSRPTVNRRQIISKHSSLNRSKLDDGAASADMVYLGSNSGEQNTAPCTEDAVPPALTASPTGARSGSQQLESPNPTPGSQWLGINPGFPGVPDMQEDLWSQTNAFEGAWDVACFRPMLDQHGLWPALNFFSTHNDMYNTGM